MKHVITLPLSLNLPWNGSCSPNHLDRTAHTKSRFDRSNQVAISSSSDRLRLAYELNATDKTGRFFASLKSS
jgi:hypothetical protein